MANKEHLAIVKKGVDLWNQWRWENSGEHPDLSGADLSGINLNIMNISGVDFLGRTLSSAYIDFPDLVGFNPIGANLIAANFNGADLSKVNLRGANLIEVYLNGANLKQTILVETNLEGVNLTNCHVYGISAWDIKGQPKEQLNLIITPYGEPIITVDNLEVAQFIYILLANQKIRDVINTIGKKGVLILGSFSSRKPTLDAIREELRRRDYVPIVFDFERPTNRDFTETIMTLAGMSRFIIADITRPRSVPLELQATVTNYMIPFVPIIEEVWTLLPRFLAFFLKLG